MRVAISFVFLLVAVSDGAGKVPALRAESATDTFRVEPAWSDTKGTGKLFHEAKIVVGPRRATAAESRRLSELLEQVYRIDWPPIRCAFVPRYGVHYDLREGAVDVLICPSCREVRFMHAGVVRRSHLGEHGGEIIAILTRMFPQHPLPHDDKA